LVGAAVLAAGLLVFGAVTLLTRRRKAAKAPARAPGPSVPREQWTMPPIALLDRPPESTGRRVAMLAMEAYLFVAIVILVIKAFQLAGV
jgi:hypothetical protein